MVAGEFGWGQMPAADLVFDAPQNSGAVPPQLRRCRRVVAITVHLPEFLVAASGLVQRLAAAGVRTDVLVAAEADEQADDAAGTALAELGVPELARHRLALPSPIGADRADDLLAGMSELVGFDPEPGVYCLAPAMDGVDASQAVVADAARRIARVYRLKLVQFTATPDAAVVDLELDGPEWARKCAALAACATQVTPLTGRREYFGL
ncbi:MAG TPA: hypothetical protein VGH72_29235 [Pseudonocardia sp.]|jgi:hypothetical protein|nr:hypothetical protein [Pseudonocardiales bacterium]